MWLKRGGLRPTRQRVVLAERLIGDGKNRHVTAESLFAAGNDFRNKVSLATVYNTLRAFCDAGLMREITVNGSKSYFDTNMTDHPHFFWEDTSQLVDAPAGVYNADPGRMQSIYWASQLVSPCGDVFVHDVHRS
ncbi:MAG: transcriptional repressor [Planktomarina sp.]|nr:transcriptional repressor [Planktomarina sp.]